MILEIICKNKFKLQNCEIDYLILKLDECDIVKTSFQKSDSLPIHKFEEFCLLWALALRNKDRYQIFIAKYESIADLVRCKIEKFIGLTDEKIGSFALYWASLINDNKTISDEAAINYGQYIDSTLSNVKTRCTLDLIMNLRAIIDNCEFKRELFIEKLADLFPLSNQNLILKVFSVDSNFLELFTSHYLAYLDSYSSIAYENRVAYVLKLIDTYICDHRKFFQLSILENLDEKIKIKNFWYHGTYQEILKNLADTQLESGVYNSKFLDNYFCKLTSESQDPDNFKIWIKNFMILLKYMFLSKTKLEIENRQALVFTYIARFMSNILKYRDNFNRNKLISILELCYKFIPGLHNYINQMLSKMYYKKIKSTSYDCSWEKYVSSFIYGSEHYCEISEHNLSWTNKESSPIPKFIIDTLKTISSYLKELTFDEIKANLKQKLEQFTNDELINFNLAEINSEDCKTSKTIAKYLTSLLINRGIEGMISMMNDLAAKNDNDARLGWVKLRYLKICQEALFLILFSMKIIILQLDSFLFQKFHASFIAN
ncbi:unnamed protein product [Blepharisma stoltei]|uniref:Uncharacterized protein n=1 Tax=Blepharisma stoltei TaxID=1481888 RepID=A0AAU9K619_9CILI|nr:unnamed protein product [Blepharisma stoltei]